MPDNNSFNQANPEELKNIVDTLNKVSEATGLLAGIDVKSIHEEHTKDFEKARELANELKFKVENISKNLQTKNAKVSSRFASARAISSGFLDKVAGAR